MEKAHDVDIARGILVVSYLLGYHPRILRNSLGVTARVDILRIDCGGKSLDDVDRKFFVLPDLFVDLGPEPVLKADQAYRMLDSHYEDIGDEGLTYEVHRTE